MPISFDSEKRIFKLDTATSSYVFEIYEENYLVHLYYGAMIPDNNLTAFRYTGGFASFSRPDHFCRCFCHQTSRHP